MCYNGIYFIYGDKLMKLNDFFKSAILTNIIFGLSLLFALGVNAGGGWNGGGDGRPWEADSAWYLTVKEASTPISYCFDRAKNFRLSPTIISGIVERSFKRWFNYINERQVNSALSRERKNILTTSASELSHCNGSEDLRLAFGTSSDFIEHEKKRYFDPLAFALSGRPTRKHIDQRGNWYGNGFIWVALNRHGLNMSEEYFALETEVLIMHELGHIFGNGYVAGTVMDQNIGRFLNNLRIGRFFRWNDAKRDLQILKRLMEIDGSRDLVLCLAPDCKTQSYSDANILESRKNELAALLNVKVSELPITSKVNLIIEGDTRMSDTITEGINLTLHSGDTTIKVDLGRPTSVVHVPIQTNVFRVMGHIGSLVRNNDNSHFQVAEILIFEKKLSGHPVTLRIERNVVDPVRVLYPDARYEANNELIFSVELPYRSF
jgi:hypothetical protein